jgi:hypothetical protein
MYMYKYVPHYYTYVCYWSAGNAVHHDSLEKVQSMSKGYKVLCKNNKKHIYTCTCMVWFFIHIHVHPHVTHKPFFTRVFEFPLSSYYYACVPCTLAHTSTCPDSLDHTQLHWYTPATQGNIHYINQVVSRTSLHVLYLVVRITQLLAIL